MNATFPAIKEYVEGASGLDWLNGKFKVYAVDMDTAGPASGAWVVSSLAVVTPGGIPTAQITTSVDHGLLVGNRFSLFGLAYFTTSWSASTAVTLGAYRKPTTSNGKKYRCVLAGTTGGSQPTWPTTDGQLVISGSAVFMCDGPELSHPLNNNWIASAIPASNVVECVVPTGSPNFSAAGYIANLSKTYLSEFAPSGSRVASAALTGKSILTGGVLDAPGFTLDGGGTSREVLVMAKAAALDADTDLADTAQRLVAYWDTMSGLPIAAGSGPGTYSISNGADRLVRF